MPSVAPKEHPKVPLTRFHNNTGEFLDLSTRTPVALTSHGRERHFLVDSQYFRHLEAVAQGRLLDAMNLKALRIEDLDNADFALISAAKPTQEEIDNDRWSDEA